MSRRTVAGVTALHPVDGVDRARVGSAELAHHHHRVHTRRDSLDQIVAGVDDQVVVGVIEGRKDSGHALAGQRIRRDRQAADGNEMRPRAAIAEDHLGKRRPAVEQVGEAGKVVPLAHRRAVGAIAAEVDQHRPAIGPRQRPGERRRGQRPAGGVPPARQGSRGCVVCLPVTISLEIRASDRSDSLAINGASVGSFGIIRRTP